MKLEFVSSKKYKLIKYYLLKYQIYSSSESKNAKLINLLLERMEMYFKQSLKIIYEYHIKQKKILFVGVPVFNNFFIKDVSKNTSHIFISETAWIDGILSNTKYVKKHNKNLSNIELKRFLDTLNVSPDLIVLFNTKNTYKIIKEINNLKIPIILFNSHEKKKSEKILYNVSGNYSKLIKTRLNVYNLLLYSILKTKIKRYKSYIPNIMFNRFYNKYLLIFKQSKYKTFKRRRRW